MSDEMRDTSEYLPPPGCIQLMKQGFRVRTEEGVILIEDPITEMGVRVPQGSEVIPRQYFGGRVTGINWCSQEGGVGRVYVYDGVFMDEDLYEGRLEEIRQEATAAEIENFMHQHDLLMIVEKEIKNLAGRVEPIFRISFYRRSTFDDEPVPEALYDSGDLYINIREWRLDYPVWDKRGQIFYEGTELKVVYADDTHQVRSLSVNADVLRLPVSEPRMTIPSTIYRESEQGDKDRSYLLDEANEAIQKLLPSVRIS